MRIPPEQSKEGDARGDEKLVALSPQAVALLRGHLGGKKVEKLPRGYVFATPSGKRPHPDCLKPVMYRLKGRRSNGQPASTDKRAPRREALLANGPDGPRVA